MDKLNYQIYGKVDKLKSDRKVIRYKEHYSKSPIK